MIICRFFLFNLKGLIIINNNEDKVVALLIDAENVSPKFITTILDEVSLYGTPAYKRIYGDWTSSEMSAWKKVLNEHNISPMQQFSYTQGKNASDSAMIIDAMDILYAKNVDGFCLVSSDSDFTRLASRLRESRMFVIGMGESKTPVAFKSACDSFKYLDVIQGMKNEKSGKVKTVQQPQRKTKQKPKTKKSNANLQESDNAKVQEEPELNIISSDEDLIMAFVPLNEIVEKIKEIIEHKSNEDGFVPLSLVGETLIRMTADFDSRNYGFNKLHKLIDYTGAFETQYESTPNGGRNLVVRNKNHE